MCERSINNDVFVEIIACIPFSPISLMLIVDVATMYLSTILCLAAVGLASFEAEEVPMNNLTMSGIEGMNKAPFGMSGSLSVRDTCGSGKKECGLKAGCCDSDGSCCGISWCCPSGTTCIGELSGTCCEDDKSGCGANDCYDPDGGETCCSSEDSYLGGHCNKGETCCDGGCCPEGTHCKGGRCAKGNNAAMAQVLSRPWAMAGVAAWVLWYSAL